MLKPEETRVPEQFHLTIEPSLADRLRGFAESPTFRRHDGQPSSLEHVMVELIREHPDLPARVQKPKDQATKKTGDKPIEVAHKKGAAA